MEGGTGRPPPLQGHRLLAQLQHPERGFMRQLSQFKSRLLPKGAVPPPRGLPSHPGGRFSNSITAGQDPAESLGVVFFFIFLPVGFPQPGRGRNVPATSCSSESSG